MHFLKNIDTNRSEHLVVDLRVHKKSQIKDDKIIEHNFNEKYIHTISFDKHFHECFHLN